MQLDESGWLEVWRLYEAAAELPGHERDEWLNANAHASIRTKVIELLQATGEEPARSNTHSTIALAESAPEPMLGRFERLGLLGRGAMGEVYKAFDPELDRYVAIKCIAPSQLGSSGKASAMLQEARAASALNHPGIVTVYEVIRSADTVAIVMELVEGESLRSRAGKSSRCWKSRRSESA